MLRVYVLGQDAHLPEADRSKGMKDRDKRWRARRIVHNVTSVLFLPHSGLLASAGRSLNGAVPSHIVAKFTFSEFLEVPPSHLDGAKDRLLTGSESVARG